MNNIILLHLSLIEGFGPASVKFLLNKISEQITLKDIYNLEVHDFKKIGFSNDLSFKLFKGLQDKLILEQELELIEKHKINWCSIVDKSYPYLLKNINFPPTVLYWMGKCIQDSDKTIAVIGSRKANSYAQKVINYLVKSLVENQWTIVSGGAIGADTMAHKAALEYSGNTIVVLGSGLLKPYPIFNKKLFEEILIKSGTLLSIFPLNMSALPGNFPSRNRVISGISRGCVVIQAALKSGTRITALHALEQGRDVFAIPGPIDDELSQGCHKLIQEGAKLVSSPDDILKEFGEIIEQKKIEFEQDELLAEDNVIKYCHDLISIEELIDKTGMNVDELQQKLFNLQLDGKIRQNFAGLWQKIC